MQLTLTAAGLACSVGRDLMTATAAIRAGLSRPSPLPHFSLLDPDSHEPLPLLGHAVEGLTDGFSGVGRWLQLATCALEGLSRAGRLPSRDDASFWEHTRLAVVTPALDEERFAYQAHCQSDRIFESYVTPLLEAVGGRVSAAHATVISEGHRGVLRAIADTSRLLRPPLERVLVIAADSWLDMASLEWLAAAGRLKGQENPIGLPPGEAAGALLLERRDAAERRGASLCATIVAAVVGDEQTPLRLGASGRPRALATAVETALNEACVQAPFAGDLIADLNGEPWRASHFGATAAQLSPRLLGATRLVLPASSTGDTGAASGAVAVACAAHALQRGYAAARSALVVSSSESGEVGALVIQGSDR
ncbi:hypothetical protein WME90_26190 [Sorangium sp. So ce375]|uniref:hypothetical protein n=1 Tax=Sorangium sp. So ce375 TaxID=3133306 RepID=UPI003F5C0BD0